MDVAVFSTRSYDREFLDLANAAAGNSHTLRYFDASLSEQTVALTAGSGAICAFVNDRLDQNILAALHSQRSEEHTSELQSLMRIAYSVFCLKKTKKTTNEH